MKDGKRLTRLSVITGTVVAVVALAVVLVTLFIAAPSADLPSVATQAGDAPSSSSAEQEQSCIYPEGWIGHPVDEDAVKDVAKSYRILAPNTPATMDYRGDRVNVRTDEDGIVLDVTCG